MVFAVGLRQAGSPHHNGEVGSLFYVDVEVDAV